MRHIFIKLQKFAAIADPKINIGIYMLYYKICRRIFLVEIILKNVANFTDQNATLLYLKVSNRLGN